MAIVKDVIFISPFNCLCGCVCLPLTINPYNGILAGSRSDNKPAARLTVLTAALCCLESNIIQLIHYPISSLMCVWLCLDFMAPLTVKVCVIHYDDCHNPNPAEPRKTWKNKLNKPHSFVWHAGWRVTECKWVLHKWAVDGHKNTAAHIYSPCCLHIMNQGCKWTLLFSCNSRIYLPQLIYYSCVFRLVGEVKLSANYRFYPALPLVGCSPFRATVSSACTDHTHSTLFKPFLFT